MDLVGYSDRLSVEPGDTIRFMVSCRLPKYRATVVRLIHGDINPNGPGFKEEVVHTPAASEYPGREQRICSGSYVVVADRGLLEKMSSFTLQAWIYPTLPTKGRQGLLTKWIAPENSGYGLVIDDDGDLALWMGNGDQWERIRTREALRPHVWYFVAATFEAATGKVHVLQEPIVQWPLDPSATSVEETIPIRSAGESGVPFLMAAYWHQGESGPAVPTAHFNGRLENPQIFEAALNREELNLLKAGQPPGALGGKLVASWDFGDRIQSWTVTDTSKNQLDGKVINMPMRGVTGRNWSGAELRFSDAPHEYAAIHFHDDDLEDCGWSADFTFEVPPGLRSGVYAARLEAGSSEDYVPFFVRPSKGSSSAPIVLLAPTFSYLAYANEHVTWERPYLADLTGVGDLQQYLQPQDHYIADNHLLSTYDYHTDGSGNCFSSRLRPLLTMRPKYNMPLIRAPHEFNADLCLIDWLEAKRFGYDVITDEDLHLEGSSLLGRYRVVLTGSHPEYWTGPMLDALQSYLNEGGRLMYLGGNGFYWVVGIYPDQPHVIEVRRGHSGTRSWDSEAGETYLTSTGEQGGLWRHRGRPPQRVAGVGFAAQGFDRSGSYRRQPASFDERVAFIFQGIGAQEPIGDFGLIMGGAAGHEIDRVDPALGTPPHTLLLASSSGHSDSYQAVVEEVLCSDSKQGGTINPSVRADMVYFETPNRGAVFSTGSISWCGSLSHNRYENNVSKITENVLEEFLLEVH